MPRPLLVLSAALLGACVSAPALERFETARSAMGTEFRIVLFAADAGQADCASEAAFARLAALDRALSDYDPHSELARFSAGSDADTPGPWVQLSVELGQVLAVAEELARRSAGAFDVTVGPYSRLWRRARRQGELPDPARLAEAAAAVGFEQLELEATTRRARLLARGMRLDLGGIAKGYALDEALAVLEMHGIRRALVVGGGEMRAGAAPPGARGWRVALVGLGTPLEELQLVHAALATSGDLEQALELDGRRYSHILDPRTGQALSERRLVSVLGPAAMLTDALATAISVLGPEEGLALLELYPGYSARVLVQREGWIEDRRSAGFPARLSCSTSPAAMASSVP